MDGSERVAVLGAGPSGLVAAKEALDKGLDPFILEKQSEIGGIWHPTTGCIYDSLQCNTSKFSVAFSGFPWPPETEMFPTGLQMFQYLVRYADAFKLRPRIQFNCTVTNIKQADNLKWEVSWTNGKGSQVIEIVDAVIVATGVYSTPTIPAIPGLDSFQGIVMHSRNYKNPAAFEGKNVLVVGGSFTGSDLAADVAPVSNRVIHSIRKPFWNTKRFVTDFRIADGGQIPFDFITLSRETMSAVDSEPQQSKKRKNEMMKKLSPLQHLVSELDISPEQYDTVYRIGRSERYEKHYKEYNLKPKVGEISSFRKDKVIFSDGQQEYIDAVIFCTGCNVNLSFLHADLKEILQYSQANPQVPLVLFQHVMHPDLPNLMFVGNQKSLFIPLLELQARFAIKVLTGKASLPSEADMKESMATYDAFRRTVPHTQFPFKNMFGYIDSTASLINCLPNLEEIKKTDPNLFHLLTHCTLTGAQFKINESYEEAIQELLLMDMIIKKINQ